MTGFGRATATHAAWNATVEISAVNRKQYDCSVCMPRAFAAALEARVQNHIRGVITRGAIRVAITLKPADTPSAPAVMDHALARRRVAALRETAAALALPDDLSASALLNMDDLFLADTSTEDADSLWSVLETALNQALDALLAMRQREGAAIAADIRARLQQLEIIAADIRQRAPEIPRQYAETLHKRLAELGAENLPPEILAREVALFADRCDISEEQTRLLSHFEQAETLLSGNAPCGRALDFLCQEFFREINTTGSKANALDITRNVIAFKTLLEAIREQVQNIE